MVAVKLLAFGRAHCKQTFHCITLFSFGKLVRFLNQLSPIRPKNMQLPYHRKLIIQRSVYTLFDTVWASNVIYLSTHVLRLTKVCMLDNVFCACTPLYVIAQPLTLFECKLVFLVKLSRILPDGNSVLGLSLSIPWYVPYTISKCKL